MAQVGSSPATGNPRRTGVLLVNLGTPDAPTTPAVRRYLREFLSDPRVVEAPRFLWWLVLRGFILRVRPARSAAAYRKIWTDEGSPLLVHTLALANALQTKLAAGRGQVIVVRAGMSYGRPSIPGALQELTDAGASRIVVLPLYPQYSNSTSGSVFAAVTSELSRYRAVPELRFINSYYDFPGYAEALAASVRDAWQRTGRGERLLFSFHGLPRSMVDKGDPYYRQCLDTAQRVAGLLQLANDEWQVGFQSRVGREEWLRPYTDETLQQWGERGMGKVDVLCPGFAVDCLETLEEIAMQNAELFAAAGGGELRYIPALNNREDHVSLLCRIVESAAGSWLDSSADPHPRAGAGN